MFNKILECLKDTKMEKKNPHETQVSECIVIKWFQKYSNG